MNVNFEKYNLNKNDYICVGVSGGSDSMALLDCLNKYYKNIIAIHINYHIRKTAYRDENIVKQYCVSHSIQLECFDAEKLKGNFEDKARDVRFEHFKEIYIKYNCKALFLAHHLNDAIETYIFKKNRNSKGRNLTILETDNIMNMNVIRPFINTFKKEIIEYCASHSIEYGFDELLSIAEEIKRHIKINGKNPNKSMV